MCVFDEATELVEVETALDGRVWQLTPAAAQAWWSMQAAALGDGIDLKIASAYRASSRQVELIQKKLDAGITEALIDKAKGLGFNTSELILVDQQE